MIKKLLLKILYRKLIKHFDPWEIEMDYYETLSNMTIIKELIMFKRNLKKHFDYEEEYK